MQHSTPSTLALRHVAVWLRRLAALGAVVLIASGCHDAPATPTEVVPDPGVDAIVLVARDTAALFQTDSLAYTLRADATGYLGEIGVTLTNRTGGTVYIVNCGGSTG